MMKALAISAAGLLLVATLVLVGCAKSDTASEPAMTDTPTTADGAMMNDGMMQDGMTGDAMMSEPAMKGDGMMTDGK